MCVSAVCLFVAAKFVSHCIANVSLVCWLSAVCPFVGFAWGLVHCKYCCMIQLLACELSGWNDRQSSYFGTYNGFAVVGGITLMVYFFVAVAMLQCDQLKRSESFCSD